MTISPISPTLEVDLAAIVRNWRLIASQLKGARCSAVVKANAYGLGMAKVAPALFDAGCREFFVATLAEGMELRRLLSQVDGPPFLLKEKEEFDATIYVFHGARAGEEKEFVSHRLIPVLNSRGQIEHWKDSGPAALHIDTGMCRLGVTLREVAEGAWKSKHKPKLILSHLACANDPAQPMNQEQLRVFREALAYFPGAKASLANSSGVFLGPDYHFDLVRPGCSLYGVSPQPASPNPVEHVATLTAPVLQYRVAEKAETVGYGATAEVKKGTVLATVEMGYADGLLRSLSNKGWGFAAGVIVPIVGRVSMDMVSVDATEVPEAKRTADLRITFIGRELPVDKVAQTAGTIGYEVFTRLGQRVKRVYR